MSARGFDLNETSLGFVEEIGSHIPGGFFIYQAEAPEKLLYANQAVADIFGCADVGEFEELTGNTFKGMVYPEDYDVISSSIDEQIQKNDDNLDYVEYRIVRKDGAIRWVDDYGHFAETDTYGGVYYVFISDITEKREQRENDYAVRDAVIATLTNSYNTMWLINDVDSESCSLYHSDMDGAHAEAIRNALSHARYTDTKTQYVATMVAAEDQERMQEQIGLPYILKQFQERDQFSVTFIRDLESGPRYYRIDFGKVAMPGGKTGVMMAFKDVDDEVRKDQEMQQGLRDAMEAADASSKAKSNFLASMSHDMRTPMNAIIGMTAIAATHLDDTDRVADCLKKITDSSSHLLSLINEVLDMNKIESGKVDLHEDDFDLAELVDVVLAMTRPQIEERDHNLVVHIGEVAHEKVVGDTTRVRQVLVNLLSNAIKYTPNGGRITCTMNERDSGVPDIGLYEFTIEDNGIGMTPEFMEGLFDPFTRADDKLTQSQQGTGLGMAITRNIVRMMGGDIQVESEYGVGTTFKVTMYLKLQEPDGTEHKEFADLHVLVADDDPISCESACCILNDLGMNSEWALTGKSAVERVVTRHHQNRDFYAVIIDWKMPDISGVETARQIRAAVGDELPIIIVSAFDWSDIEAEAREAGVTAFISKPFFKTKFVRVFQSLVENADGDSHAPLKKLEELSFTDKRVLLVEDNHINAEIATHILRMTGLEVDRVENGEEAVEHMSAAHPGAYELVFMDIQMPRMDGYAATKAIRALGTDMAANIPIIAMTANAFEDDRQQAFNAGMNGFVAKPLNFDELSAVLQQWI